MKTVRTFADLTATLSKRASVIKVGAETNGQRKNAAGEDVVSESDPADKGTTAIPKDADGATKKTVGLENKTNDEVTSSFALSAKKTVEGEEKPATELAKKAQGIAQGVRKLSEALSKKSGVGSDGKSVTPNMPPNDKVNEGTTSDGKLQPPSGGTSKGVNPDPNAKAAGSSVDAVGTGTGTEKKVSLPAGDSKGEIPASKTNTDTTTKEKGAAVDPFLKLAANILSAGKEGEAWLIKSVGAEMAAQIKAAAEEKCKGCGMVKTACTCQPAGDKDKTASGADDFKIDSTFHVKLATIILATEEGRKFAQAQIEKAHGAEAAGDIIKAASIMEERAVHLAQLEESGALAAEEKWASATPEEQQKIVKLARVHARTRDGYQTDLEKMAYDAGAMAAAQMGDAGMLGGAGAGAGPDAGAGAAPGGMGGGAPGGAPVGGGDPAAALAAMGAGGAGGEGGAPGGAPGGEGLSEEAVVAALDQMVQSGELTPELAAEILQAITGGGGAPGGEAGGMPPGAGGMPPGAEAGGGMPPGAAGGAAAGGEGGEPKPAKKEDKSEKPEKKDEGEDKEAALIKRAHELAVAAIKAK
jgi:hypothetical protein